MIDIRFRGRNANVPACWIYGYFVIEHGVCCIINDDGKFLVIAGTVGQFIGIKDKNMKDLYSDDIIRISNWEYAREAFRPVPKRSECEGVFVISINFGHWGIETDWDSIAGYECSTHIMGDKDDNDEYYPNVELIGNTHENPDILN